MLINHKIIHLKKCTSTNTIALEILRSKDLDEGVVIITNEQIAGRGQVGNKWESEPHKNINMSIVLKPFFLKPKDIFILNMLISNSIHSILLKYLDSKLTVKWPNDIYYKDKKLVGILIENIIVGNNIKASVIGIGVNVNQIKFNYKKATSILLESNKIIDLKIIRDDLINQIISDYNKFRYEFNRSSIKSIYLENLYRKTGSHLFKDKNSVFLGKIKDINESGKLVIKNSEGNLKNYATKEIEFV